MRNDRPSVPTRMNKLASKECLEIIEKATAWLSRPEFSDGIGPACAETLNFLKRNDTTYDENGNSNDVSWINTNLIFTKDKIRLDIRRSILRNKIFSEGIFYLLKILDKIEITPSRAFNYADKCRDLAEFAIHEHLMAGYYAKYDNIGDDELSKRNKINNINLSDLRYWYLYSRQAKLELLRPIATRMAVNGLWTVTGSEKEGLPWSIKAGPVSTHFHKDVFFPALEHFHDMMRGKAEP